MSRKVRNTDAQLVNMVVNTKGQRDRLLTANRHQSEDIFALTAALREVYGILRSKGSGHTDEQRIDLASKHIASVIVRFGGLVLPSRVHSDESDH